ncbi:fatty acid desaturase [Basilea psittacipulmonis]|uniref:Fatty acid desaturase n=1 Tax=Basilea psittacipulmonis DSM 24701 TaxID=1072685 RepID=A0A077DDF2_9BURK|nr:fatty acid desaturase [Basilea psittacipulmonis]AIL32644.1 fatty acid desaturase [Basilea psittacipulmonis DSM 24701]
MSSDTHITPIPPNETLPPRKVIRGWIAGFANEKNTVRAIILMSIDIVLFFATLAGVVLFDFWLWKLFCSLLCGFVIGRLFIIGHDACHQSLTDNRKLNKILGRIAFLPSVSPYSLWDVGHNVVHHGYTNLKGVDFVWAPSSKEEYDAMSPLRQWLERVYRSGWAPGLYYMIEIWWKRMMFPSKAYMGTQRKSFFWDGLLCSVFGIAWAGVMIGLAMITQQSIVLLLLLGWAVPLFFWFSMIGLVVYVHHTHTKVVWHDDKKEWAEAAPFVSTTVHHTFKMNFGALLHHIMEHTAHHVDMSIPLYELKKAQSTLEEILPERIVIQPFSWDWYMRTARACKLYDFKHKVWTDFDGKPIERDEV